MILTRLSEHLVIVPISVFPFSMFEMMSSDILRAAAIMELAKASVEVFCSCFFLSHSSFPAHRLTVASVVPTVRAIDFWDSPLMKSRKAYPFRISISCFVRDIRIYLFNAKVAFKRRVSKKSVQNVHTICLSRKLLRFLPENSGIEQRQLARPITSKSRVRIPLPPQTFFERSAGSGNPADNPGNCHTG